MEGEQPGGIAMTDSGGLLLRKPTPSRPQASMTQKILKADSPMTIASSFLNDQESEHGGTFSHLLAGAMSPSESLEEKPSMEGRGSPVRGSFAERLAARGAANTNKHGGEGGMAPRSTGPPPNGRYKPMPPQSIPIPRGNGGGAGYLTIPPGLSPTTLFNDSPVLLANAQAEPSPTTGSYSLPSYYNVGGTRGPAIPESSKDKNSDQGGSPGFVFKPLVKTVSRNTLSPLAGPQHYGMSPQQAHAIAQMQMQSQQSHPSSSGPSNTQANMSSLQTSERGGGEAENSQDSEQDQQLPPPMAIPAFMDRPQEDGYNWRKYGQKQVKGSEYPRSYYKCTQTNCPMKKKVERSHDGQVTEIVYKGDHNHPKPQPTRRMALCGAHLLPDNLARESEGDKAEPWGGFQAGGSGQNGVREPSSPSGSEDEGEEGSKLSNEDGDDDEPDSKRRRRDDKSKEVAAAPRTIREPRVVVQTTSDVDILDDGYRWRKYGQKVVKGNLNPRSYYKCTNVGCPVRKHVERASNDIKAVITTYEGKHNHDVPAARNSGHEVGLGPVPISTAAMSLQDQGVRYSRQMSYGQDNSRRENMGATMGLRDRGMGLRTESLSDNPYFPAPIAMSLSSSMSHENGDNGYRPQMMSRPKQEQADASSQHRTSNPGMFQQNMVSMSRR